ncbi:hypothetical protein Tco_1545530, partial [Tanacetum coccineum]
NLAESERAAQNNADDD